MVRLELRRQGFEAGECEVEHAAVGAAALERNQQLLDGVRRPRGRSATPRDVDVRFVLTDPALAELVGKVEDRVPGLSDGEMFPPLTADAFHRNKRDDPEIGLSSVK